MKGVAFTLLIVAGSPVFAQHEQAQGKGPSADEFRKQIARLAFGNDVSTMLEALEWLGKHEKSANAQLAIPALEKCVTQPNEPIVRADAVVTLGMIALHQKKSCPMLVLKAIADQDESVRQAAYVASSQFRAFESGSVEFLLTCVGSTHHDVQISAVCVLGHAGRMNKRALAALQTATRDKSLLVRHNAHVALFNATDDLEVYLRYLIRVREEPEFLLGSAPQDKHVDDQDKTSRRLILVGALHHAVEWSENRPQELASIYMKLLNDTSPLTRRGAARFVAASGWQMTENTDPSFYSVLFAFAPELKDSTVVPKRIGPRMTAVRSKVATELTRRKVHERLMQLSERDMDDTVRTVAREALLFLKNMSE